MLCRETNGALGERMYTRAHVVGNGRWPESLWVLVPRRRRSMRDSPLASLPSPRLFSNVLILLYPKRRRRKGGENGQGKGVVTFVYTHQRAAQDWRSRLYVLRARSRDAPFCSHWQRNNTSPTTSSRLLLHPNFFLRL